MHAVNGSVFFDKGHTDYRELCIAGQNCIRSAVVLVVFVEELLLSIIYSTSKESTLEVSSVRCSRVREIRWIHLTFFVVWNRLSLTARREWQVFACRLLLAVIVGV